MFSNHPWGESPVVDKILEPYVGLRPCLLTNRTIMTLQCYVDDSGSEPQSSYFVLAGYVSKVGKWKRFTEQWNDRLEHSNLRYFKMSEAMNWQGEFSKESGWELSSIQNEVSAFASIISENCESCVSCRIERSLFHEVCSPIPTAIRRNKRFDNPYHLLFLGLISNYWLMCEELSIKERCDFIFDEQHGFQRRSIELYHEFTDEYKNRRSITSNMPYIGSVPVYGSDMDYLPLQAADMAAWILRRHFSMGNFGRLSCEAKAKISSVNHFSFDFNRQTLGIAANQLIETIEKLKADNPLSKWY